EEDLGKLGEKSPNRYCRGENGKWCCPPGEAYAEQFRLHYRVRSSAEINWAYQRNTQFLEDYFRLDFAAPSAHIQDLVLTQVLADPGLCLSDLYRRTATDVTRDDVHWLIAAGAVYVDLYAGVLVEPDKVHVFLRQELRTAYERIAGTRQQTPDGRINLTVGSSLTWDGRTWTVVNAGHTQISLVGVLMAARMDPLWRDELGQPRQGWMAASSGTT